MVQQLPEEIFHYGNEHVLQTVSVTRLSNDNPDSSNPSSSYWVIYVHGGAWRDPTKTSSDFHRTQSLLLLSQEPLLRHIAGFASINYRLSAHPDHPQDPSTTDPKEYRHAKHPDHIHDVRAALALLQDKYGFGERYILIGHSCGATLAFQSVMGLFSPRFESESAAHSHTHKNSQPTAILGVAGIYDCRLLRDHFRDIDAYQQFLEAAFGPDEMVWDAVSPARVRGENGVERCWGEQSPDGGEHEKRRLLAVLAYSEDDELVDPGQAAVMREMLRRWEERGEDKRKVAVLPVKGRHDEIWRKGEELARAIAYTFEEMRGMGLLSSP